MTDPSPATLRVQACRGVATVVVIVSSSMVQASAALLPASAAGVGIHAAAAACAQADTRVVPIVSRDPAAVINALRTLLPEATIEANLESTPGEPHSLTITASSTRELERIEALLDALDRIDITGEAVAFMPTRAGVDASRIALLELLGSDGAISGLALGIDPIRARIVMRGERPRLDLALEALAAIDADPKEPSRSPDATRGEFAIARIAHASPDAALTAARALLPTRVQRGVRAIASPDRSAVILAGDAADLALWRAVLSTTIRPSATAGSTRMVQLSTSDAPRAVTELLDQLAAARKDGEGTAADLIIELDPETRELVLIGPSAAIEQALDLLRRIEGGRAFERESTLLAADGRASDLARVLSAQSPKALPPRGREPALFEALDPLDAVLVRGEPGIIDFCMTVRSSTDPRRERPRVACEFRTPTAGAAEVAAKFDGELTADIDPKRSMVRASGVAAAVDGFERAMLESRGLRQPHRTARIVPVGALGTGATTDELSRLLGAAVPVGAARSVPRAEVRALPSIRALFISGEPAQLALLSRVIAARESGAVSADTPLRLLDIRCGRARAVEQRLRERFDARDADARDARPVLVVGDDESGALSVAMHPEMLVEVARAIDELDARDDGSSAQPREVFSSTLAQSDPAVVARALNGLFPVPPMPRDANGHALPHLREPRELFASADQATRMVWVESASDRTVALDGLVGLLDQLALPPAAEVRLFRLDRGDITRVVQNLRDLAARGNLSKPADKGAAQGAQQPSIVIDADPMSRTLVVVGDKTAFETTEEVLRQLGTLPVATGVRVIDACGLDPDALRTRALKLAVLEPVNGEAPLVAATADPVRGVVTAVGDEAALERFAEACRRLVPRRGDAIATTTIAVRNRGASAIAETLDGIGLSGIGTLAVTPNTTRSAVVGGSRRVAMASESLVHSLDVAEEVEPRAIVSIPCRDAGEPAKAIAAWLAARTSLEQRTRPAEVRADPDGDALFVSAHDEPLGAIEGIVRDLGRDVEGAAPAPVIRVVPLRTARAESLASLLGASSTDAMVRVDGERNTLIVAADATRAAMFAAMAERLDQPDAASARVVKVQDRADEPTLELRALAVRQIPTERAAALVRAILGGVPASSVDGLGATPIVTVGEDAVTKRILVSAAPEFCALADALVDRIDRGGIVEADQSRLASDWVECKEFEVRSVDPEVVARVVAAVIEDRARWPAELNDALRMGKPLVTPCVVADPFQSRLFVSAPSQLLTLATEVVQRLDAERPRGGRWEMRVYPVARNLLTRAANASRQAIAARTPAGAQPPRIDLIEVRDSDALIAAGEPSWLDAIDLAVRSVDVRGPRDAARVRVLSMRHGQAVQLAPIARELLGVEPSVRSKDAAPEMSARTLADARINSVALLATPAALDLAEEILAELDAAPEATGQRSLRLYELEAGEAAVVAKSILDLFETDDGTEPLPTVRVQPSRNSLLVRATDKQRVAIDGLVARADATAPARARVIRTIALSPSAHTTAEIAAAFGRVVSPNDRVSMAVDTPRNSLLAFGTPAAIEHAEWVIGQLVQFPGALDVGVRRFELPASAEPRATAAQASAMFGQLGIDWRYATGADRLIPEAEVVIVDRRDERAIACIASDDGARMVEAVLAMLARGQNAGPIALRHIRLSRTDAGRVGGLLRDEASRADGTLLVVDGLREPAILLVGSPREVEAAALKAARIDRATERARTEEVCAVPLRGIRAADAVALVASVMSLGGAAPWLVAEPVTNVVVMRGDARDLKPLVELLARLDDPTAKSLPPFEAIQVSQRAASEVRAAVEVALAGSDAARRDRIRLVADDALGFVFVRADQALIAEVRAAIAAADVPPPPPVETPQPAASPDAPAAP
ncbi:MAG: hypothetical protein RLY21_2587 [Planctomycetota bacterium]|jgi:type II secretory pathway component GspD/PulD (secretin)